MAVPGCVTVNISDIQIIAPDGATLSDLYPMPNVQNTWYKNMTWFANISGQYLMCSKALDSSGFPSKSSCFTLIVGIPTPTANLSTAYPANNSTIAPVTASVTFQVSFNVEVIKPTLAAYVRIFSANNPNASVYEIDSAIHTGSVDTTTFTTNQMSFPVPLQNFAHGWYYVKLDYGNYSLFVYDLRPEPLYILCLLKL